MNGAPPGSSPLVPSGSHRSGSNPTERSGPAFDLPSGGRWGQYHLLAELGRGAFGVVYRARHLPSGSEVALKVLLKTHARALQRFEREVEAVRRLDHPHLVRLLDAGVQAGHPFLVTELVAGPSLAACLQQRPLAPFRAAELLLDAARALEHAHARGVLHRDVKPENLLVDARGAHLVDFGLARLSEVDSDLTQSGALVGTGPYLSPEQARGERARVDARSDVYGLGATLYEALTGRAPFVAANLQELLIAIIERPPPSPRALRAEIPAALEAICLRCLAKDPADRYPSAAALVTALEEVLDGSGATPARAARPARGLAALILIAATLLAVGVLLLGPPDSAPPAAPSASLVSPGPPQATPSAEPTPSPLEPGRTRWQTPFQAKAVRRVGPWALLIGDGSLQVTRGDAPLPGPAQAGPAAAWDGRRLLLGYPDGVLAWRPGEDDPRSVLELPWQPATLAWVAGTLLAGSHEGLLLALADGEHEPRWRASLGGRIAGAPLGLDLDRDGRAEHLLVATRASRLVLLDLATGAQVAEETLPSPAHGDPLVLAPSAPAQVLVACREGVLARYAIRPGGITPGRALDLERALVTPLALLPTEGAPRVVIGTRFGWLFCLDAELERVEWAVHRAGTPAGEIATVDLDLDGTPEVCSAWVQPQGSRVAAEVVVHTAAGLTALELPVGERPLHLAGGDALPLIGAGAGANAWGPWLPLDARPPREDEAWALLCGGASVRARALAAALPPERAATLEALLDWHSGDPRPIEALLADRRPRVEADLQPAIEEWLRQGDVAAARRLGRPLGVDWSNPESSPLEALGLLPLDDDPHAPLAAGASLTLELRRQPALSRGLERVELSGGRFRGGEAREQGLLLSVRGRLRLQFLLGQAGRARLHLLHRSLPFHVPGYAAYRLVLDGRPLGPAREAPPFGSPYEHEQIELGRLAAGEHTLEISVLPQATTLYSLARLELVLR